MDRGILQRSIVSLASALTLLSGCSGDGAAETGDTDGGGTGSMTGETDTGGQAADLWDAWGIRVHGFEDDGYFDVDADGVQTFIGDGTIEVEGLGTWPISTTSIVEPMAMGGTTSIFVSNADLSEERYFLYDPVQNYITIGDFTKGVAVSKNPDGSYDVWAFDGDAMDTTTTVPNGFEALKIVEQYNEFKQISPFILLTAFVAAHNPTPEPRCISYQEGYQVSDAKFRAETPPVCGIFKEFCDCGACLVLDRQGACDACPQL